MSARKKPIQKNWVDPDDAPTLTRELARRGQISVGGNVVREASGTITKRGRPPVGDQPKQQVTMRLAPELLSAMRNTGPGWQVRAEEALRRAFVGTASDLGVAHEKALRLRKNMTSIAEIAAEASRLSEKLIASKSRVIAASRVIGRKISGHKSRPSKKSA